MMLNNLNSSGIYSITSPSGGQYIGSAINIRLRWHGHKVLLRKKLHKNIILQNAWNKYGEDKLSFCVLLICSADDLLLYEQLAFEAFKPNYNICPIAGNSRGVKWSAESRRRKSEQVTGTKHSDEIKRQRSIAITRSWLDPTIRAKRLAGMTGHQFTDDQRAHMSKVSKGKPKSDAHRAALSIAHLGQIGPWKGKSRPQNTKEKISIALKGRPRSAESIAKQRATNAAKRLERL